MSKAISRQTARTDMETVVSAMQIRNWYSTNREVHPLEIKKSKNHENEILSTFKMLDRGAMPRGTRAVLHLRETLSAVDRNNFIVSIDK